MGEKANIYVKTHSLEPLKSFLGKTINCPLERVDSDDFEMYSCDAVIGMQMQLTRRDNPLSYYVDEIEGEIIDYSELGFYITFNPTREIFDISEMYDWQFHTSIFVGIMISRELDIECLVMKLDKLIAKFVPKEKPKYFPTYYSCRHVFTMEEILAMNKATQEMFAKNTLKKQ